MDTNRLSKRCRHLLSVLDRPGAFARQSPINENRVIASVVEGGISMGGGSFELAAVDRLRARDLVRRISGENGRPTFVITEAGRACLRRSAAADEMAFLAQHQDLVEEEVDVEGVKAVVMLDASEGPLDWLRRRKDHRGLPLIDDASHAAGERLRRDLTLAMMVPSVTTNWQNSLSGGLRSGARDAAEANDASVAARQRVTKALKAVGPDFADLLIDLCAFSKGLACIEMERGWPARSAKIVVKLALARLADHYGLERAACGPAHSRGIRTWHSAVPADDECEGAILG